MSEERKPCPFCGAAPQERFVAAGDGSYFEISCRSCAVAMTERLWNRRTPGIATQKLLDTYAKHIVETARKMDRGQGFTPDVLEMVQDMEGFIAEWKGKPDA